MVVVAWTLILLHGGCLYLVVILSAESLKIQWKTPLYFFTNTINALQSMHSFEFNQYNNNNKYNLELVKLLLFPVDEILPWLLFLAQP